MNRRDLFRLGAATLGALALGEPKRENGNRVYSFASDLRVPGVEDGGIWVRNYNAGRDVRVVSTYEELCERMGWVPMRNSPLRELFKAVAPEFIPIEVGLMTVAVESRIRAAMRAT